MKKLSFFLLPLLLLGISNAHAQQPSTSKSQTNPYVGLSWSLGHGIKPEIVIGVMQAKVKNNGDTTGANLAMSFSIISGISPSSIKLGYLGGKEDYQGNIGVGYSFLNSSPLVSLGMNAPHAAMGLDISSGFAFTPYLQLHSQGKFKKPADTISCESYEILQNGVCVTDPNAV